eukprot:GCRY01004620.1.p1 GENE.GCRY01004620.1~~GCRY01004620.1.p1  ORF type:complete len:432 (+),score=72.76 GCRY01004620.1:54-1298(+)
MDQKIEGLQSEVDAAVAQVKELKANKAPKEDVNVAVEKMQTLRKELDALKSLAEEMAAVNLDDVSDDVRKRYSVIRSIGEECIQEKELLALLSVENKVPIAYDGFEPSGRMHIAQGILKSINVNKLTENGCRFKFWVGDWFALMNNKLGGDLEKIRTCGRYFVEVWKATGMDLDKVEFLWSAEEINNHSSEYWSLVLDIASRNNVPRVTRCSQIMGRTDEDSLSAAQIFYPCMQCADVFFLKADICQLGLDQRKVNMLAREYAQDTKRRKPIILSHHMLMGLGEGQAKMSKSNPDSAIFMEDTETEVNRKIKKAFCPIGTVEGNPILDYCKHLIFPKFHQMEIKRKEENGGDIIYTTYEELEAAFVDQSLHPGDLKSSLSKHINSLLQPVRDHFKNNKEAAALLKKVKNFKVTR